MFLPQLSPFGEAFDGEQELAGADGLDEVVADFAAEGVLHDVFFFAFGDHHDGERGPAEFDLAEGVEAGEAGHLLVEQDEVGQFALELIECVGAGAEGRYAVVALFEEEDVRFEEVDLVVDPEDFGFHVQEL